MRSDAHLIVVCVSKKQIIRKSLTQQQIFDHADEIRYGDEGMKFCLCFIRLEPRSTPLRKKRERKQIRKTLNVNITGGGLMQSLL